MADRYGDAFSLHVPVYGPMVVVANPKLAKQVFTASPDVLGNIQPNLSRLLGSGSVFALDSDEHRQRRRLLAPPFHGKSIKNYESIIEEETLREIAELAGGLGVPHPAVDDAHHAQRDPARGLRRRGRRARRAPPHHPAVGHAGFAAGHAAQTVSDLWSLTHRGAGWRTTAAATTRSSTSSSHDERSDPNFENRDRRAGADAAQHLRRRFGHVAQGHRRRAAHSAGGRARDHRVHARLGIRTAQSAPRRADRAGGRGRRPTTTSYVRRRSSRCSDTARSSTPPAGTSTRRTSNSANGPIPRGYTIIVSIARLHADAELFPDPDRFDPQRFVGAKPPSFGWLPVRRRRAALCGRGVREHGDGCRAANGVAPLHDRRPPMLRGRSSTPVVWPTLRRTAERSWFVGVKIGRS